ncbi:VCBS repeat-containing protein [Bradyrhizobium huanghuaihaiense]|uniref:VCBS repeat-containing protein n=1 Tax=Bradyrhizobium huanghuaihaiense TaxID=990078 RepID=A0A562R9Y5_9BRAD|nr:VCBS domain-containing protein [Bradyrhizobium huanghuaihaiense]TWI65693.1 VCBS repeat-containing protein [Bradyrhizobium huanghuaihaiense]
MSVAFGVGPQNGVTQTFPLQIIGIVQSTLGYITLTRENGPATQVSIGDLICRHDVIETAADAQIGIRLLDGTIFSVGSGARVELREFACESDCASRSTIVAVTSGSFAFAAGRLPNSGTLTVDTPLGSVRGRSHATGFGILTMAALTFSMVKEAQGSDPDATYLDSDTLTYKDLQHGAFELITKERVPRHIIVDDPGETVILNRIGSSVSVNQVTNSAARMEELRAAQQDVLANLTQGPTGSSTPPGVIAPSLQHINFNPDNGPAPPNLLPPLPPADIPLIVRPPPSLNVPAGPTEIDTIAFNDTFAATTGTFSASSPIGAVLTYGLSGGTAGTTVLDGQTYDLSQTGAYGTLYLNSASGAYTFVPNADAINALSSPTTMSFIITVSDTGFSTSRTFVVNIHGVNDTAIISGNAAGTVVEAGGVANSAPGAPSATGTLTDADVDNPPNTFTEVSSPTRSAGGYGTFTMTVGGVWTYTLDDSNGTVQSLNVGDTLIDRFTVTTIDGTPQLVTITINGTNDAAIISGTTTGSVVEAGGTSPGTPVATGTLLAADVDNPANTFVAVNTPTASAHSYGSFTITAAGLWIYTLDNNSTAVQALNNGATLTDNFTVTSADGTAQTVTITINGSNDGAIISGTTSGAVIEAGGVANGTPGTPTATGTLTDLDPDNASNTFTPVTTPKASVGGYGTFTMTALGTWTYALDNSNATVQALNVGNTLNDQFTVTTVDGTPQLVTITINGTNDAASISGTTTGSVLEAGGIASGTPVATGTLTDTDLDNPANTFTAVTSPRASDGGYGTFTMTASGLWTYTLDNGNAVVDALDVGDTIADHFTVTSIDGTTQEVTIAIHGASDADPNDFDNLATGSTVVSDPPFVFGTPGHDSVAGGGSVSQIVYGGAGDDTLNGTGVNDTIYGGSGNDTIKGNNGADIIYGGSGQDTIAGSNENDTIIGGFGADNLTGSNGDDVFVYLSAVDSRAGQFDTITDFRSGSDKIDLTAIGALGFVILALSSTSSSVPPHTIAWIYDSSANETIVYVNPTDQTLQIGDSSLVEVHLQGVATIDSSDFIVDQAAAPVQAVSDNLDPAAATQGDAAVMALSTSDASTEATTSGGSVSLVGSSPAIDVSYPFDINRDHSGWSHEITASTPDETAALPGLSQPAIHSLSIEPVKFVFEPPRTDDSIHPNVIGAIGMTEQNQVVAFSMPEALLAIDQHPENGKAAEAHGHASLADTASALLDIASQKGLGNGGNPHSNQSQESKHSHASMETPDKSNGQPHSAADDTHGPHGNAQAHPSGPGDSFKFVNPAIEKSGVAFVDDLTAPPDHHEGVAHAYGHGGAAAADEVPQLDDGAHGVGGSGGPHGQHDLLV